MGTYLYPQYSPRIAFRSRYRRRTLLGVLRILVQSCALPLYCNELEFGRTDVNIVVVLVGLPLFFFLFFVHGYTDSI